eukprot:3931081-Prymnesium_polylepis.1
MAAGRGPNRRFKPSAACRLPRSPRDRGNAITNAIANRRAPALPRPDEVYTSRETEPRSPDREHHARYGAEAERASLRNRSYGARRAGCRAVLPSGRASDRASPAHPSTHLLTPNVSIAPANRFSERRRLETVADGRKSRR